MTLDVGAVQMVSKGFEAIFRSRAHVHTGEPVAVPVEWQQARGCRSVRVPALGNTKLACLGEGKGGPVN